MEFIVGDILELDENILFYDKGLTAQVVEIENEYYGWVRILNSKKEDLIGKTKHANLTLFKLVRRGELHV